MKLLIGILFSVLTFSCAKSTDSAPPAVIDPGVTTFAVTAPNATASYTINASDNPSLTLKRGFTYTFNVSSPGHPFYIKSIPGTGTGNAFTDGVTGNGTASGTITFTVPSTAPATLYYNCSVGGHTAMAGTINITD